MAGLREKKREILRKSLIRAATARIKSAGLHELRARDITSDAGCALGTLYSAFKDLDNLILEVNSITLKSLGDFLDFYSGKENTEEEKLQALAKAYMTFAIENPNLWESLFTHKMGGEEPQWYLAEYAELLARIKRPLSYLAPHLNNEELTLWSKTLFSAVHGIVSFSLARPFVAVPVEDLETQLHKFVQSAVRGI